MPLYEFHCAKCGTTSDRLFRMNDRPKTVKCNCGARAKHVIAAPHTDREYQRPVYSDALGINPRQISAAMRAFPHHEYHPTTGQMILRSHRQRQQALKDLGCFDRS